MGDDDPDAGPGCEHTLCDDECVDITQDPRHCGECFDRCDADERCVNRHCVRDGATGCRPPAIPCNGTCVDPTNSPSNCGGCGIACGFGYHCSGGTCIEDCFGTRCGNVCTDLNSDSNNCGGCGVSCGPARYCSAGSCVDFCDGTLCGGECVDLSSDRRNCGNCAVTCSDATTCVAGICQVVCPPDTISCNGRCVDWRSDPVNCGGCSIRCASTAECIEGNCIEQCATGSSCAGECVDLTNDPNHCGSCFSPCAAPNVCSGGTCNAPTTCGDRVVKAPEENDPPPGPVSAVPLDPRTCRYDFAKITQWYCNGDCGNWGGGTGCDKFDADAFCKLKMDNPRATAVAFSISTALPGPGVCCPPPTFAPGTLGCTSLGVLSSRGVSLAVSVHPTNLQSTHQGGNVITNLDCDDP